MNTSVLARKRQRLDVLIENKVSFAGENAELSIYDTYQDAQKVALQSTELLFCGMISGKKIMHVADSQYHSAFMPHQSFVLAPGQQVLIDFPDASLNKPTTCLAIEISTDKIRKVVDALNFQQEISHADFFQYVPKLVHSQHNPQTQQLLQRMITLFSENEQHRDYLIDLSLNELITRLLQQQSRDLMLASCQQQTRLTPLGNVLLYIEQHLSEAIDITTLCKIACMSRSKFYQQFKLAFGVTPAVWQQQLRLQKAYGLLQTGERISQVCYQLGFNDPSHFSRVFKHAFGSAPKNVCKQRH
ncbi:AraC family transcriptional regulator [Arsukibacterium ikkense]|uniref:AraC family transcriptional regulator n=1 Tax=Arsukibacterium ikkense TaxID=336831 RepID=A0A0M2V872_9GAMM|nr:AraC family transcriptional regulator [Arsukibacterium ikkense]KKO45363.1 AraC family transcriptional regulator [Arsukibacterium ikkense]